MTSIASEANSERNKKQLKKDREVDKTIITALLSTVDGRRWLWLKMAQGQLFIEDADLDAHRMAFKAGKRVVALQLLQSAQRYSPTMFVRMLQENSGVQLEEEDDGRSSDDDDSERSAS
jgi:hypothetical protein